MLSSSVTSLYTLSMGGKMVLSRWGQTFPQDASFYPTRQGRSTFIPTFLYIYIYELSIVDVAVLLKFTVLYLVVFKNSVINKSPGWKTQHLPEARKLDKQTHQ